MSWHDSEHWLRENQARLDVVRDYVVNGAWLTHGACRGVDTNVFFPEIGTSDNRAKAICRACPVRIHCLEFALASAEKFGVWGGLSEKTRKKLRAQRRRLREGPRLPVGAQLTLGIVVEFVTPPVRVLRPLVRCAAPSVWQPQLDWWQTAA